MTALITFSSDYGYTDEFVGVCHLVISRIAPDVRVLDVVHGLRGIRSGSFVLAQSLIEAPDDETYAKAMLSLGAQGNVSTETLKAFSEDQFRKIVDSLPDDNL